MKILERSNGTISFEITRRSGVVHTCLIDAIDEHLLTSYTWHIFAYERGKTAYVRSGTSIYLHRLICDGQQIDHANGNGLDNRRGNLRPATRSQNALNRQKNITNKSGWKGVSRWHPTKKSATPWRAVVNRDGRQACIGYYRCPLIAALAYDNAVRQYHGAFGRPNLPL